MTTLICLQCPNGCKLTIKKTASSPNNINIFLVSGNKCEIGTVFAKKKLKEKSSDSFRTTGKALPFSDSFLKTILAHWNIPFHKSFPGHFIQGSPERSTRRLLCLSTSGKGYILEQISREAAAHKKEIAARLFVFKNQGLPVIPCLPAANGAVVLDFKDHLWMLTPYLKGTALNRDLFWQDKWRGQSTAAFLDSLYKLTAKVNLKTTTFYISDFISKLLERLPDNIAVSLKPVVTFLKKELFPFEKKLTTAFCHGDPHPFNIIWGKSSIQAVIDWEFSGTKAQIYDAALVCGCVGIEDEVALDGAFIKQFITALNKSPITNSAEMELLPLYTIALRFAWLAEWLRRGDKEMLDFEIFYIKKLQEKATCRNFPK